MSISDPREGSVKYSASAAASSETWSLTPATDENGEAVLGRSKTLFDGRGTMSGAVATSSSRPRRCRSRQRSPRARSCAASPVKATGASLAIAAGASATGAWAAVRLALAGGARGLRRCDAVSVGARARSLSRGAARVDGPVGRGRFDRGGLRIEEVADPAVGADLAQPPGNFADHARAAADRRKARLERGRRTPAAAAPSPRRRRARIAASASGKRSSSRRCFCARKALLDSRDRIEHHAGVGVAVALGVFAEEPAAPRRLHEGFADRVIVLLARHARRGRRSARGRMLRRPCENSSRKSLRVADNDHTISQANRN